MALGQPVADNRQVGHDAVDVRIVLVKGAKRSDRFLGETLELRQQVVDGFLLALESAARLLDQCLQAGPGLRIEGAQELVEIDRAQRVVAVKGPATLQLRPAVDGRDLDVLLRQQGRVANARRRELVQRCVVRGDPHGNHRALAGGLDAGDLADAVAGDHDVGATIDAVGIAEGRLYRIVLPGRDQAEVEWKAEADIDRHRQQQDDQHAGQRHHTGPERVALIEAHQPPPLQAMRAGLTGSVPVKT